MKTYLEPAREIPVKAEVDVLVCGAGPSGFGAAVAAARAGARTMLVEQTSAVGGIATSGLMSHWTGDSEGPLLEELSNDLAAHMAIEQTALADQHVVVEDRLPAEWQLSDGVTLFTGPANNGGKTIGRINRADHRFPSEGSYGTGNAHHHIELVIIQHRDAVR